MGSSLLVSFVIAIPLGLFTGVKKNSFFDRIVNFISYVGISMPVFWFALLLVYLFSLKLNLLPSMGMRTVGKDSVWDIVQHGILPCMVLAF
ncbi:ABC transporter permease subunit, partial [Enterobacter cloacae]